MTALNNAGASSGFSVDWTSIDWSRCRREVRRLQTRIVKATQAGRYGKVKALQWLLTHSFSAKALAAKRVTENRGKNTPGIDQMIWSTPSAKSTALLSLYRRGYRPSPLRRIYIPKRNGQRRPLGIPTMQDRAMQALHLQALEPIAETTADPHSYGFRPQRSTADAIEHGFKALARKNSPQWVLEADIKGCFDNISHDWIIQHALMDKTPLKMWLKAGYLENDTFFATEAGTPQGGIISPTLANLALDGLQSQLEQRFTRCRLKGQNDKVNFVRYADDFIITGASKALLADKVLPIVKSFLAERQLWLSEEKTQITHIEEGFDFLGQTFRKYNGKLLIKPSKKSIAALLEKVRGILKTHQQARPINVIRQLNPIIRGWVNYHRHVVAKEVFQRIDYEIWRCLWQWAKRRHPKKGKRWIKHKYFKQMGARNWVFAAKSEQLSQKGQPVWKKLIYAGETPIKRHIKIKATANPYDPEWASYFERRTGLGWLSTSKARKRLTGLWLDQNGLCVQCNQPITRSTRWHLYRREQGIDGDSEECNSSVLLHQRCYQNLVRQRQRQRLSDVKSAPEEGL